MVIYSIIRHSPEVGIRASYTDYNDAMKALKRIAVEEECSLSSDAWECSKNHILMYEIEESYLFGIEQAEEHAEGRTCRR